jgi:hypothetical protein
MPYLRRLLTPFNVNVILSLSYSNIIITINQVLKLISNEFYLIEKRLIITIRLLLYKKFKSFIR